MAILARRTGQYDYSYKLDWTICLHLQVGLDNMFTLASRTGQYVYTCKSDQTIWLYLQVGLGSILILARSGQYD